MRLSAFRRNSIRLLALVSVAIMLPSCGSIPQPTPTAPPPTHEVQPVAMLASPTAPVPAPTATPPPPTPQNTQDTAIPTPDLSKWGDLVIIFRDSTGVQLSDELAKNAYVYIYSSSTGALVDWGIADKGVFQVTLPAGEYDLASYYDVMPSAGSLHKRVLVPGGSNAQPASVLMVVPSVGTLKVDVQGKNGDDAQQSYEVDITSGTEKLVTGASSYYASQGYVLRSDLPYTVTAHYGDEDLQKTGVRVAASDQPTQLVFDLPYSEAQLHLQVRAGGKELPDSASVEIRDPAGKKVASSTLSNDWTAVLQADVDYKVHVTYKDQPAQDLSVRLNAGETKEQTVTFASP